MIKVTEAIKTINPNATYAITGSDLNTCKIEWLDGTTPISKADIEAKMAELQTAYDAKQYQRDREVQYPSLKEFVEAYTEKEINGNDTKWIEYKTKYNKVRTDNPKS